jgi:phosphoglycolate phosphatase
MSPALIFDLDGTLVDTAPDLLGATNAVLAGAGRAPIDPASLRHMVGFGAQSLITQAMAATGPAVAADDLPGLVEIFITHYRAHIADFSRPFAGVEDTLKQLARQGARLGILTNKPAELTGLLLDRLGMTELFAAVYGAGRKSYSKPDPRIFHDVVRDVIARESGGPAVMIGDSITDLSTARAAGAPCILMSYGYTPVPARELGGDLVLDEFAQLPAALKKMALL